MESPDAERLAPVFYLPGARAASGDSAPEVPARPTHPSRRAPTFSEMFGEQEPVPPPPPEPEPEPSRDRDAELARAENVSLHALTRRGQSRRELERLLRSRDLADDIVAHEADRLERVGLLDDVALAQNLVGILQERKGLGRTGIAAELTRRLLSPAAIEYALELVDSSDELARARELAVKRAAQLSSYDRTTAERRLSGYLARRGYSGSTVRAAVEHALTSRHPVSAVRFR